MSSIAEIGNAIEKLPAPQVNELAGWLKMLRVRRATAPPVGLSARNVFPGRIASLQQRDVIVSARVKCRVEMEVHLTLAARDSLQLAPGKEVWLVIKTHSCHLMQGLRKEPDC